MRGVDAEGAVHRLTTAAGSKQSFGQGRLKRPNFDSSLDVFVSCLQRKGQTLEQICFLINCTTTDVHASVESQLGCNEQNSLLFKITIHRIALSQATLRCLKMYECRPEKISLSLSRRPQTALDECWRIFSEDS